MKLFKSIDDRFREIGFMKVEECKYVVKYKREKEQNGYMQILDLVHKESGKHVVQSYDMVPMGEKKIENIGIVLTMYEMKLCLKKMKQMGWKMVR